MRVFDEYKLIAKGNILPFSDFRLFRDIENTGWSGSVKTELIKNAEVLQGVEYPTLKATDFLRFHRDGNRIYFENKYFKRRNDLLALVAAEFAERKGRFTDAVINLTWLILEETTWVLPAHAKVKNGLPYEYTETVGYIDLFAATTAATLAFVYHFGAEIMGETAPVIRERILYELNRRILIPYQKYKMISWMGFDRKKINNWNPWVVSNILTVAALCVTDLSEREIMTDRLMSILDNFINGYEPDGGCDEGPGYWNAAGASMFDALEILYDMSGGKIDVFGVPLIRKMGEYIMNVNIKDNYYVTFADAHTKIPVEYEMVARFGRRTNSKALESFGKNGMKHNPPGCNFDNKHPYRSFKRLCDRTVDNCVEYVPKKSIFMDDICIFTERECEKTDKGLYLAAKGGNNNESHNHNDVGSFIVYADGEPLLIDAGVETYSRDTFDLNKRYSIWTMQSAYHNLPTINGVMQSCGEKYKAGDVFYNDQKRSLSMQLKKAYPDEAKIENYVRTITMKQSEIEITDDITLYGSGKIEFNIMLADEPTVTGGGVVELRSGRTLKHVPDLTVELDTIDLTDEKLREDWEREKLYRLRFVKNSVTSGKYTMIIK